jgi:hypothetical protein
LNVGRLLAPVDSPEVAEFMNALEAINLLAEASPGFVWRLAGEDESNATDLRLPGVEDSELMVNMSVWIDLDSLRHYVYRSGHAMYLRRKKEWFAGMYDAHLVLWWVPEGHIPTLEEAAEKLRHLREEGPTPEAFTMSQAFDPTGDPTD